MHHVVPDALTRSSTKRSVPNVVCCRAASRGEQRIVRMLLEAGCEVNAKNKAGLTPLQRATARMHTLECVFLLLEFGAKIDVEDNSGRR